MNPKTPQDVLSEQIHAPCCDVFHLKGAKFLASCCCVAAPILLEQLGVLLNLQASFRH